MHDGFRPLSRQIGIYTIVIANCITQNGIRFPAPREVDRQLYLLKISSRKLIVLCFRPLSRQIGSYTTTGFPSHCGTLIVFPAPREVDRWLHYREHLRKSRTFRVSGPSRGRQVSILNQLRQLNCLKQGCFRPLSRQIGSYICLFRRRRFPWMVSGPSRGKQMFILDGYKIEKEKRYIVFTAPREVDRQLNNIKNKTFVFGQSNSFPAPREVDRELYIFICFCCTCSFVYVSGPSRGRQGAIQA